MNEELKVLLLQLISNGYEVGKIHGATYEEYKAFHPKTKLKLEVRTVWGNERGIFIGEVTSFSSKGQWIKKPVPHTEYFNT